MTSSIGYANPAAVNFGTLTLEHLRTTNEDKAKAEAVVRSWLPDNEADEVLTMLGIEPPRPGRE